jgi:hypothetical protein
MTLWRCPGLLHVGDRDIPETGFPTLTDVPEPHPRDGRECRKCRDSRKVANNKRGAPYRPLGR